MIAFLLPTKYLLCIYHANTNKTIHFAKFHFVLFNFARYDYVSILTLLSSDVASFAFLLHFDLIMRWNGVMMFRFIFDFSESFRCGKKGRTNEQTTHFNHFDGMISSKCEYKTIRYSLRFRYSIQIFANQMVVRVGNPSESSHDKQWRMINLLDSIK